MKEFDLVVIGAGPGGYVAAIRGAQKGMRVACIEKSPTLGGTCLNVGCIPSKALLHSSEYYDRVKQEGDEHGILTSELSVNLTKMMQRKERIVSSLTKGIELLFEKNKITRIEANAKLISANQVQAGDEILTFKHLILATGSEPIELPFLPFDEKTILSSTGALSLKKIPKKMLLVGAGVIGLELGSVYQRLGTEVEVVEMLDRVIPPFDHDLSKQVEKILTKQGFNFHLSTKVVDAKKGKELTLDNGKVLTGDLTLVAIGRKPYYKDLGLETLGIATKNGQVQVDANFQTTIPNIYAIGDLIDGPMLAHKASEEGVALVDYLSGESSHVIYPIIPNVMYTWPEVASVGLSESEAKSVGHDVRIGKAPLKANARAKCSGDSEGLVKLVGDKKTDRLLGMHIVAPNASEMIGEGIVALDQKITITELAHLPHAHPTVAESIKEAALALHKQAIHF